MKKRQGYVSVSRSLQDNFLWTAEPFTKGQAWIDLIMYANWKDTQEMNRGEVLKIARGQFYASDGFWMDRWQWSRNKVRKFFVMLEEEEMIVRDAGRRRTVITIVKYDEYQTSKSGEGTTEGITESTTEGTTESISESTTEGTTKGTQQNKDNNKKNINKRIKDNNNINNNEQCAREEKPFDIYNHWMISTFGEGKFDNEAMTTLRGLVEDYGEDLVRDALEKTIGRHGATIAYTAKILLNNAKCTARA